MADVPKTRYDLGRDDVAALLSDQPRYRVDQAWSGWWDHGLEPSEISTLPMPVRHRLEAAAPAALSAVTETSADAGDTTKWLWRLVDGHQVESVLMHSATRSTVCVSTQAGCAMGCGFCATGQMGFDRHLGTGEIVEQVVRARRRAADDDRRLSNVVFMGMGEPLANLDRVWPAVEAIHDHLGLGARHLTLSTVGVVPGIRRLAAAPLPVSLAVSLHAATDDLRDQLVPINVRYPLDVLMGAVADYLVARRRRVSFEWACIDGVNDTPEQAEHLAALSTRLPLAAHVNLIPLNPTPGYGVRGTSPDGVAVFARRLRQLGVNTTIRRTRGSDIDAACGQLAVHAGADPKVATGTVAVAVTRTRDDRLPD